jgi:hypothetical protein
MCAYHASHAVISNTQLVVSSHGSHNLSCGAGLHALLLRALERTVGAKRELFSNEDSGDMRRTLFGGIQLRSEPGARRSGAGTRRRARPLTLCPVREAPGHLSLCCFAEPLEGAVKRRAAWPTVHSEPVPSGVRGTEPAGCTTLPPVPGAIPSAGQVRCGRGLSAVRPRASDRGDTEDAEEQVGRDSIHVAREEEQFPGPFEQENRQHLRQGI